LFLNVTVRPTVDLASNLCFCSSVIFMAPLSECQAGSMCAAERPERDSRSIPAGPLRYHTGLFWQSGTRNGEEQLLQPTFDRLSRH
jgi:hypothetical protein